MSETITDLRKHLFAALRGLTDKENPMDIDRARAVSDLAQTVINTAKVEVDYIRVSGGQGSGFIPEQKLALAAPAETKVPPPGTDHRRHILK